MRKLPIDSKTAPALKNIALTARHLTTTIEHLQQNAHVEKRPSTTKNWQQKDKQMTEQNKTFAEIAKAAIEQTVPQQNTIIPKITLSKKTHLKIVALILEARIASLHDPRQYGQILSKSLKENFDIDATFPDRDSKKVFNFYYNQDNNVQTDMDDGQYIDVNDIRRSSLNLSYFHSADPPPTKESEKRPRFREDDFLKPTKTARRWRTSDCTRKSSASSSDGQFWNRKDFED